MSKVVRRMSIRERLKKLVSSQPRYIDVKLAPIPQNKPEIPQPKKGKDS